MDSKSLARTAAIACFAFALVGAGCKRNTHAPELQSVTVQPQSEPVTASGCLKAGMAEDTFVLTAPASAQDQEPTTTYQLTGHDVALRDYVGQEVQVSGTVQAREQVDSSGPVVKEKPKGTSGTPTVETKTELTVKQMTVDSVVPSGERCAPELPPENQPMRRIK